MELCSILWYVAAWMGGQSRGEWTHVCVWQSTLAVHLKLSQRCVLISYIPKRVKKKKKIHKISDGFIQVNKD